MILFSAYLISHMIKYYIWQYDMIASLFCNGKSDIIHQKNSKLGIFIIHVKVPALCFSLSIFVGACHLKVAGGNTLLYRRNS